jgi:hypothetical protein
MSEIDLDAIESEVTASVGNMTPAEVEAELMKLRVRQKVAQKKYQSPERQKTYQAKQRSFRQAIAARARELGVYDSVNAKAGEEADRILAESDVEPVEEA